MRRVFASSIVLASLVACGTASADDAEAEARTLYARGAEHAQARRCDEALPLLRRSYALRPSPSSALLVARCLRDLGRPEESWPRYEAARSLAESLVANGDAQHARTLDAARVEGTAVRAELRVLRVRVTNAKGAVEVTAKGISAPVGGEGFADLLVRPGHTQIEVRGGGPPVRRSVDVSSEGVATTVTVELPAEASPASDAPATAPSSPKESPPAPRDATGAPGWMLPAGFVATGLGAAGLVAFGVLGAQSQSLYEELESSCGAAGCGPERDGDIDRGERLQTFANVALVSGAVACVAGAALVVLGWPRHDEKRASVGAGFVRVRF